MGKSPVIRRARQWVLLPLAVTAVMLGAACAPDPGPGPDPSTPWLAPGCYEADDAQGPDLKFSGQANVKDNVIGYLNEDGSYDTGGECVGDVEMAGTIVRSTSLADAAAKCTALGIPVTSPAQLIDWGYDVPIDAWVCANTDEAAGVVEFTSPSVVAVSIFGGTPEEPSETNVNFSGTAAGTWDLDNGDFALGLTVDDGFFPADTPLGPLDVYYTAAQAGAATGSFDPATGEGGFSADVTMTLVGLNGPTGIAAPCDIVTSFDFEGAIDLATGALSASQEEFEMTPPGAADCGGLGALIGDMLTGDSTNAATITMQVLTIED